MDREKFLPTAAREKLHRLQDDVAAAHAATRAAFELYDHARREVALAKQNLAEHEEAGQTRRTYGERAPTPEEIQADPRRQFVRTASSNEAGIKSATERLARVEADLARRKAAYDAAAERADPIGALVTALNLFVEGLDAPAAAYAGVAPKLPKSGLPEHVEKLRGELGDLAAEAELVRRAPIPSADAKAIARRQVEALAERGRPDPFLTVETGAPVKWPGTFTTLQATTRGGGEGLATGTLPDGVALLAWLARDEMIEAIEAEIDKVADDDAALTVDERKKRETDLAARRIAIERAEEVAIEAAEAGGTMIVRRPDADPRAVLGLA